MAGMQFYKNLQTYKYFEQIEQKLQDKAEQSQWLL